jgi:hypothetical protein
MSLIPFVSASLEVIPSFLSPQEIDEFMQKPIAEHRDNGAFRHISDVQIKANLHHRIRQALTEECEVDVHDAPMIVSSVYATTPLHQDYFAVGEKVSGECYHSTRHSAFDT